MYGGSAVRVEQREHVGALLEPQPREACVALDHRRLQTVAEDEPRTRARRMARAHLREHFVVREDALDEDFHGAAGRFLAGKTRLVDARVVDDDEIVRPHEPEDVWKLQVLQRAGCAVDMQQPARGALARRRLRDQLAREVVVEVFELHGSGCAGRGTRTLTVSPPADFESAASTSSAIPAESGDFNLLPLTPTLSPLTWGEGVLVANASFLCCR
jgi:hypothetical protein